MYTIHRTLYIVQFTMYIVHCTVYIIHSVDTSPRYNVTMSISPHAELAQLNTSSHVVSSTSTCRYTYRSLTASVVIETKEPSYNEATDDFIVNILRLIHSRVY